MTAHDKAVAGIRCCLASRAHTEPDCEHCPYADGNDTCDTLNTLFSDILEALNESDYDAMHRILHKADPDKTHVTYYPRDYLLGYDPAIELREYSDSVTIFFGKDGEISAIGCS